MPVLVINLCVPRSALCSSGPHADDCAGMRFLARELRHSSRTNAHAHSTTLRTRTHAACCGPPKHKCSPRASHRGHHDQRDRSVAAPGRWRDGRHRHGARSGGAHGALSGGLWRAVEERRAPFRRAGVRQRLWAVRKACHDRLCVEQLVVRTTTINPSSTSGVFTWGLAARRPARRPWRRPPLARPPPRRPRTPSWCCPPSGSRPALARPSPPAPSWGTRGCAPRRPERARSSSRKPFWATPTTVSFCSG